MNQSVPKNTTAHVSGIKGCESINKKIPKKDNRTIAVSPHPTNSSFKFLFIIPSV